MFFHHLFPIFFALCLKIVMLFILKNGNGVHIQIKINSEDHQIRPKHMPVWLVTTSVLYGKLHLPSLLPASLFRDTACAFKEESFCSTPC